MRSLFRLEIRKAYSASRFMIYVTWTLRDANRKKIEAFEMSCYRSMLRIKWVASECVKLCSHRAVVSDK